MIWILAVLSIIGSILNVFKIRWGFVFWIVANFGWILVNYNIGLYEQIPIWIVFNVVSLYGFYTWSKDLSKLNEVIK